MRKFLVTVNGRQYEVEIEEVGESSSLSTQAIPPNPAPLPAPKEQIHQPTPVASASDVVKDSPTPRTGVKVDAPMPGTILDVRVEVGKSVDAGMVLVILEAMKMENEIVAPQAGKVVEVLTSKGATVDSGDTLVVLE